MGDDDETDLLDTLTVVVEAWTASGQAGSCPDGSSPGRTASQDTVSDDALAALHRMGYLEGGERDDAQKRALTPTTEALSLTDPWLCPELASSLQAAFHERYLRFRADRPTR
ncbi:MAG: hypothetical protein WBA46_16680 [Thermomicrobiales bacterium]